MENGRDLYERVWDILVENAGAPKGPHDREGFVLACLDTHRYRILTEYRFGGKLGFGGKFWRYNGRLYINCYPEDLNPAREAILEKVNQMLAEVTPEGGVHGPP